jgi:hypothetical protein
MNAKGVAGAIVGIAFLSLLVFAVLPSAITWPTTGPGGPSVGVAMWQERTFEILVQSLILLGGVVAILLLLESRRSRGVSP